MKKQPVTTKQERKMKFAEAGVLFVLVLAITLFVGVRLSNQDSTDVAATAQESVVPEIETASYEPGDQFESETDDVTAIETNIAPANLVSEEESTLAQNPPRIVTYALAEQTYFDGEYAAAAELFDTYVAEHPDNAWGHYMLGLSEWKAGELDASEEAFIAALEIRPDHFKSLINYGRVLLALERPADARAQIELALQSSPDDVVANRMYSRIAHHEGRLDDAETGYLKVLQIQGDDAWSLNNLGLIRIEQERFDEALAPLAKAARLNTDVACFQNNLGVALERTGHYSAAATAFEMALASDSGYAKADESLDRVSGLTEASDLVAIDLIALAESFDAAPVAVIVETLIDEESDEFGDLEVAATTPVAIGSESDEGQDQR